MKRQKRRDTRPELVVRRIVRRLGHYYRIHNRDLPGSPDLANRKRNWAIFVNGCYWHHHEGCPRATIPKANRSWWIEKFRKNRQRDAAKEQALRSLGFEVIVIWECETKNEVKVEDLLRKGLPSHEDQSRAHSKGGSLRLA